MFEALSGLTFRRRRLVLAGSLVFIGLSAWSATRVFGRLKGGGFDDPDCESSRAAEALHRDLGRDEGTLVVLFSARTPMTVDDPAYRAAVESVLAPLKDVPESGTVLSFFDTGLPAFVSEDRRSTFALVGLNADKPTQQRIAGELRPKLRSDVVTVRLGGYPAVFEEINRQVREDLKTAELLSLPLVTVLLVVIFGSLVAAALPLVIGITTILGAFFALWVVSLFTDVSIYAVNIVTMLGLGLAIDYSLFVVSRFREEMARRDNDVGPALRKTLDTAGRTVLFSGVTVAASLLSLEVFPVMFLRSMGTAGAAVVFVAMAASLTMLPAVLAMLGPRVNRWSVRKVRPKTGLDAESFWYRSSLFVMRWPGTVLALTAALLVVLGLPFLRARFAIPDSRVMPAGSEGRTVSEMLATEFQQNETDPVQIVLRTPGPAVSDACLDALHGYVLDLKAVPGVRRVTSLVSLDDRLERGQYPAFYAGRIPGTAELAARAEKRYSKDSATVVDIFYDGYAYGTEAQDLVRRVRAVPLPAGFSALVGGKPAGLVDFLETLGAGIPTAFAIIVSVIFVLLFLMLGSLVIPVKAVLLNILSLSVSFGALVWIFQDGHFADLLGFTPLGNIDGTQPVLIFAVAFGLSMDYEVFLLSRVKENYDRTKDSQAAVALGVTKTGSIITSAALLLVVVIGAFAAGKVVFVKQLGIGLGLAVLLDATLVRMLLVPATMQLMGRHNWWAPKPLLALYHKLGFAEVEGPEGDGEPRPDHARIFAHPEVDPLPPELDPFRR